MEAYLGSKAQRSDRVVHRPAFDGDERLGHADSFLCNALADIKVLVAGVIQGTGQPGIQSGPRSTSIAQGSYPILGGVRLSKIIQAQYRYCPLLCRYENKLQLCLRSGELA